MKNSRIFFSIIIPVYNVEAYIEECLNSVLNQTFKNFELIIVNDGSSDKSMLIAQAVIKDDARVSVINQPNGGLSRARNTGIDRARGEYFYFLDSDDLIDTDMLRQLHQLILKENWPDIVAFNAQTFVDAMIESAETKLQSYERYYSRHYLHKGSFSSMDYYFQMHQKNNVVANSCFYITKSAFFREKQLRFYNGIIHEDELFTRQLLMEAERVFYCGEKYYFRRLRPDSITQSKISKHKIVSLIKVADELLALYKKKGVQMLKSDAYKFYSQALRLMETVSGEKEKPKTPYARWSRKVLEASRLILVRNRFLRRIAFKIYYL